MGGWRSGMLPRPLRARFHSPLHRSTALPCRREPGDGPAPHSAVEQHRADPPEHAAQGGREALRQTPPGLSWDNGLQRRRPNGAGSLLEGREPGVPSLLGLNEKRLLPDAGWGWRGDSDSARLVPPDTIQPLSAPLALFRVRRECAGLARRDSRRRLSDDGLPRDTARARRQRNPADQGWGVTQGSRSSVETARD